MLDYLDWFGDVDLDSVPFNEVDNAILAQLAYVAFEGVVPTIEEGGSITVAEAAERYQRLHGKDKIYGTAGVVSPLTGLLPQKMAQGRRFRDARLGRFHSRLDAAESEQLCVFHVSLSDGSTYVTFRGTDDTLVGWREDFEMTFGTVTSQRDAVTYLDVTCADVPAPIMVGGHSKGGNLAVYGAALCAQSVRDKISAVWNDDGPGFDEGVLPAEALDRVRSRVRTYVPEFDVVGQLLGGETPTKIVASSDAGVMQHSAMGWQVLGPAFVPAEPQEILPAARRVNEAFDRWLGALAPDRRREVFSEFFDCLQKAEVTTLSDLYSGDPQVVARVLAALAEADPAVRESATSLLLDIAGGIVYDSAATLADAAAAAWQSLTNHDRSVEPDPNGPLSEAEMERYRRKTAQERSFAMTAKLFGATPEQFRRRLVLGGAAAGVGVAALVMRRTRRNHG